MRLKLLDEEKDSDLETDSEEDDDSPFAGLRRSGSKKRVKPIMLWVFTNVEKMQSEMWSMFENNLFDIYKDYPQIRFMLSTTVN